jgi:hypothetical protein
VASKADLIFKLKGKEKLQSGIDYNIDGAQEGMVLYCITVFLSSQNILKKYSL